MRYDLPDLSCQYCKDDDKECEGATKSNVRIDVELQPDLVSVYCFNPSVEKQSKKGVARDLRWYPSPPACPLGVANELITGKKRSVQLGEKDILSLLSLLHTPTPAVSLLLEWLLSVCLLSQLQAI